MLMPGLTIQSYFPSALAVRCFGAYLIEHALLTKVTSQPQLALEAEAKKQKRSMWVQGDKYISPREWRRGRRN